MVDEARAGDDASEAAAEYRIEELATTTGTTVRTLQAYRSKGLLPPPRRVGRVALYSGEHVDRLRLIGDLLSRGYSLSAIGEVFASLGRGERVHDLLGSDAAVDATPGRGTVVTPRQVEAAIGEGPDALAVAVAVGMLVPADEDYEGNPADQPYRLEMPAVLQAGAALVAAGIPPDELLAEAVRLRDDARAIAERFVRLGVEHAIREGALAVPTSADSVTELVGRVSPLATEAVAEFVRSALKQQIHDEVERQLEYLLGGSAPEA